MMQKSTRRISGFTNHWSFRIVILLLGLGLSISCHRDFESPYIPGSKTYAGDEWTRDADHDGIADSVAKYSPTCTLSPPKCLEQAKVVSVLQQGQNSVVALNMVLWMGDAVVPPRLIWSPAEASIMGYRLTSSDSSVVKPIDGSLKAVSAGSAQITVFVPGSDAVAATFIIRVMAVGKRVVSISAKDITLDINRDTVPQVLWSPTDASVQEYFMQSDRPDRARIEGQKIRGVAVGIATITLETTDGGKKTAFTVTVQAPLDVVMTDSIYAEEMFMVSGATPEPPVIHWYPDKAADKRYNLLSLDTSIASLNDKKDMVVPKATGIARVYALALDGSAKTSPFIVNVFPEAVPVKGIKAADMNLILASEPQVPNFTWLPPNATNRKYSLVSGLPEVASTLNGKISALTMGTSEFIVTTQDGAFQDTFMVNVGRADTAIHVDSVRVPAFSVALGTDRKPTILWYPENSGNRAYSLVSNDTSIAVAIGEFIHPVRVGTTKFTLTAADGAQKAMFQVTVYVPVTPVTSLLAKPMSIVLNDPDQSPEIEWTPASASNLKYTLSLTDTTFATIIGGNKVHAKAIGSATVLVKSEDGPTTTFLITIYSRAVAVTSVSVGNLTMNLGDIPRDPPNIVWKPTNATNKKYSLKAAVGATLVATITLNKIEAVGLGKTVITLTPEDNPALAVPCTLTVVSLVRSISAPDDTLRLGAPDQDVTPRLVWDPQNPTSKNFTLTSNDTNVVKPIGKFLRAVNGGKTTVTVIALDGSNKADTFKVVVQIPMTKIMGKDYTMKTTDPLYSTGPLISWLPANVSVNFFALSYTYPNLIPSPTSIVTIVSGWQFKPVGPGTVSITVMSVDNNALKDTLLLTIIVGVQGVIAGNMTMSVGDADQSPVLTWTPTNATNKGSYVYGGTPGIATVVGNKVHPVGPGTATFLVKSVEDSTITSAFSVTVAQPIISVVAADISMKVGELDRDPSLTWNPATTPVKTYTLTSLNPASLMIVSGKLHAMAAGNASVIINTTDGNKVDTFFVYITQPVNSLTVADMILKKGEDRDPVISWNPTSASNKGFALMSLNTSIASIITGNKVHGVAAGATNIVATSADGGKVDTFSVSVSVPVISIFAENMVLSQTDPDTAPIITWNPSDATDKGYTLTIISGGFYISVSDGKVQPVNRTGGFLPQVTVTSHDGQFTSTFTVEVKR
jgi:uncharacterized protein YjdB